MSEALVCPWSALQEATLDFCEERLCGWVAEPANTWSNIGYFVVGVVILYLARKDKAYELSAIGIIAILVGLGSTFFHASATFIGEVIDVSAMFLFANFMLCFNWWRLSKPSLPRLYFTYAALTIVCISLLIVFQTIGIAIFIVLVSIAGLIELRLFQKRAKDHDYRPMFYLLACIGLAYLIWFLDHGKVICRPENHVLQGHSLWHLFNCLCFYFLYRFYQPFLEPNSSRFK